MDGPTDDHTKQSQSERERQIPYDITYMLLGRKVMVNLDSILKSRDVTLPTNICLVKAMIFPVAMYRSDSWTMKKAEHQRTDAFELWCWRRLLSVL